jgi:hypothetical protein
MRSAHDQMKLTCKIITATLTGTVLKFTVHRDAMMEMRQVILQHSAVMGPTATAKVVAAPARIMAVSVSGQNDGLIVVHAVLGFGRTQYEQ